MQPSLLDQLAVGVAVVRPGDGRIVYVNAAFARTLGYRPEELVGQPVSVINAPLELSPEERARTIMATLERHGTWAGEIPNRRKDGTVVWCSAYVRTLDDPEWGRVWLSEHVDISVQKAMADALDESEGQLRSIVDNTSAVIYLKDLEGRYLLANQKWKDLFHLEEDQIIGRTDHEVFSSEVADAVRANDLRVQRARVPLEFDEVVPSDDLDRTYISVKFPLFRSTGEIYATCGISTDITERMRTQQALAVANETLEHRVAERTAELSSANARLKAEVAERRRGEERRALLMAELDHRVKNTLATVLALADETLDTAKSFDGFRLAFPGRIRAMARSHEALARGNWEGIDIAEAARLVLAPFEPSSPGRLRIHGEPMVMPAAAALPVCLALHELGTNALKYGGLSRPGGLLEVSWQRAGDDRLAVDWIESGGPSVVPPARLGGGLVIVRDLIEGQLGGSLDLSYRPEGVRCRLRIPMPATARPTPAVPEVEQRGEPVRERLAGARVLVVEDDRLQAGMLGRWLATIGCTVIGPALTLGEAVRFACTESVDVAVLDVNLDGTSSESAATVLADVGVPFVFVTGYGHSDAVPSRFAAVPRLVKPVDLTDLEQALLRGSRTGRPVGSVFLVLGGRRALGSGFATETRISSMNQRRATPPETLAEVLRAALDHGALGSAGALLRVCRVWPEAVGAALAGHSRPTAFRDGALVVEVEHPLYSQELKLTERRILDRLRHDARVEARELVFAVARPVATRATAVPRPKPRAEVWPVEGARLVEAARGVADPELRAAIAGVAERIERGKRTRRSG
ncbi:MAG: DUF721 domain-containing protein [Deltaproteobacteria bacterium]|nr:DUF721 domain-containing protein [Deltaproteobacteria bacterium]